jgi:hypothetical protein
MGTAEEVAGAPLRIAAVPQKIAVALIGNPAAPGAPIPEGDWTIAWDERQKIELEVEDNASLGFVVDRALSEFGVVLGEEVIAAYVVDLALQDEADRVQVWDMTLVDDEGRAIWTAHDLRLIPYSQLVQSADAGAIRGDPRRLYVVLREPIGNGLGIDWPSLVQAWHAVDEIVARIGQYGGAAVAMSGAYRYVRNRLRRGMETVGRNAPRWSQRGANPYAVFRLLTLRPTWAASDLRRLLGCSEDDAEATLELFGFAYQEGDGLWHQAGDQAAGVLAAIFDEAASTRFELSAEEGRQFEERIDELLRTGEPPPERTYGFEEEHQFFELVSVALTSENIVAHGRIGGRDVQLQLGIQETAGTEYDELWALAYRLLTREVVRIGADVQEATNVDVEADVGAGAGAQRNPAG